MRFQHVKEFLHRFSTRMDGGPKHVADKTKAELTLELGRVDCILNCLLLNFTYSRESCSSLDCKIFYYKSVRDMSLRYRVEKEHFRTDSELRR